MSVIILSGIVSGSVAFFFKRIGGSALWLNRGKKKEGEEEKERNEGPLRKPSLQAAGLFSAPYVD